MIYWPTKPQAAIWDLGLDWAPTLGKLGDPTITGSVWTRLRGTANVAAGAIVAGARQVVTRVSGGTPDEETIFRNQVTLSDGKVLIEDVFLKVRA
jgi:hypothetical protein